MTCRALADADTEQVPRIAVADDNREIRRILARALRQDLYEVTEAADGDELLEILTGSQAQPRATPIELVISDVRMPGRSGLEVLEELRRTDGTTPFLLVTGSGDAELCARALREGATAVFQKPFDLGEIRTAVQSLVGRCEPWQRASAGPRRTPLPEHRAERHDRY